MSDENENKEFDDAFNAVSTGDNEIIEEVLEDDSEESKTDDDNSSEDGVSKTESSDDDSPEVELTEVDKLQQTIMRQAAAQSALQKELNNAKVVKPKQFEPILDENGVFTDSFEEIKKEFPEADFGRVEQIISQQQEQINNLSQQFNETTTQFNNTQAAQNLKNQTDLAMQTHPDLVEAVQSEQFIKWQGSLTPTELNHVRNAVDATEINNILNVFKSVTGYKSKATMEAESAEDAKVTVEKRNKRNKAAQGIPTKQQSSPAIGVGDSLNEDAIFDKVFSDLGIG